MNAPVSDSLEMLRSQSLAERFAPERRLAPDAGGSLDDGLPASFWEQAAPALIARAPGTARSAVFEWYDLFHELGARHAGSARVAFTDYSTSTGLQPTSYRELVERALALAIHWGREGVGPGCTVCIVFDPRATYVASLLAAWHCGAAVCVVPPSGPEFVRRALAQLAANVEGRLVTVVSPKAAAWIDAEVERLEWRTLTAGGHASAAHRFAAADIAAYFFSPLTVDWLPLPVTAEQLYLSALRDALLLLQLGPLDVMSAPSFCDLQFKPSLILAALAAGAQWVEFDEGELSSCRPVKDARVTILGVSRVMRRLLVSAGAAPPSTVRRWFRNVAEAPSTGWTEVQVELARAGAMGMNYFCNAAAPGAMLFSDWTSNPLSMGVVRAPGLPCELTEPNGTKRPQLSDVGMLSPMTNFEPGPGQRTPVTLAAVGKIILAQTTTSNVWVTNLDSHRDGKVLPEPLIEALLLRRYRSQVRAAIIVPLPNRQRGALASDRLIVFVTPSDDPICSGGVEAVLRDALGGEWSPSSVTVFELNPRLVAPDDPDSEIDRARCAAQYLDGMLWAKARAGSVFRELASLAPEFAQVVRHLSAKRDE